MKMTGERTIPAPQSRVWEALNDPEVLKQSIPGCIELVKHSPSEFSAKVMAKVGPVKATFAGDVTLSNLNPPHSYRISGKGTGGVAGFAEGGAEVRLEDAGGQTRLVYDVDAKVGGKLAQIGSRLIESTARRMADDFFNRFAEAVARSESELPPETPPGPAAVAVARTAAARKDGTARKSVAKSAAPKKSAAAKPGRRSRSESIGEPEPVAARQTVQSPPPQVAAAALARPLPEARVDQPKSPKPWLENNIWFVVGAGVAALLLIILMAKL